MNDRQLPTSVGLRFDLVDDADAECSSDRGHAIKIARRVQSQTVTGTVAIAAGEIMNHGLGPCTAVVGQLINDTATRLYASSARPSDDGCALEIALAVEGDALVGLSSIRATAEAIENSVRPTIA